jgi:lysophospholipase L1-like esterase
MKVKEKMLLNSNGLKEFGPVNIVIFGDSVSHGAMKENIDYENVYWNRLKKRMNQFREYMPVNMINAAIGGTTAHESLKRVDKQVLCHQPDLVIVCFGLNDVNFSLEEYLDALKEIFEKCNNANVDAIFMTPNMLNTYVAEDTIENLKAYAAKTAEMQNEGRMDKYIYSAIKLAESMNITVCDCYSKWKKLSETEDTTMLLINRINHPTPEMHQLFADSLYEIIIGDTASNESDSTMLK